MHLTHKDQDACKRLSFCREQPVYCVQNLYCMGFVHASMHEQSVVDYHTDTLFTTTLSFIIITLFAFHRCDSVDFSMEDASYAMPSAPKPEPADQRGYVNAPGPSHREVDVVDVDEVRPSRQCQNLGCHSQPRGIVHARPSSAVYRAQVAQRRVSSGLTRTDTPMLNNISESPSLTKKKSAGYEAARLHSAVRGQTPFKHQETQDLLRVNSDRGENVVVGSELVSALEAERRKNLKLSSMLQAREKTYMMKELQNRCFVCVCVCVCSCVVFVCDVIDEDYLYNQGAAD